MGGSSFHFTEALRLMSLAGGLLKERRQLLLMLLYACREGRLIYQVNGQGSINGTSGSASCPSGVVIIGYSGIQICEGVGLLQVELQFMSPVAASQMASGTFLPQT